MAAVNELRNAKPRPVSLNRSVYQLVRTPIDDDPDRDTERDRPAAQQLDLGDTSNQPEEHDDDEEDEDGIPGLVDVEQQSPPLGGVVVGPHDERTTTVERVADHEQDRDEQERQDDRRPDGHEDLGAVALRTIRLRRADRGHGGHEATAMSM